VTTYGPLGDDREAAAIAEVLASSFAFPAADALPWIEKSGRDHVRVLREKRRAIACLLLVPMGQWFGGRSVPMVGIAGVGVAPDRRGRGAAAALMVSTLRELRAGGCALSSLYPATQVLYRKVGYEQAGARWQVTVPAAAMASLDGASGSGDVRPLAEADHDAVLRCYRDAAAIGSGWLDRRGYVWDRVRQQRGEAMFGYATGRRGEVDGYVYFHQKRAGSSGRYDLVLTDLCARTARASRRLLGFLGGHRSLAESIRWHAGSAGELLLLAEQTYQLRLDHHWMLRIVDLRRAFTERGYPPGVAAELHLSVRDEVLRDNAGRWVLAVEGGRARVRRGGRGDISLHVRALASLYSGYLSPLSLRSLGLLDAEEDVAASAAPVFAGPAPGMPDMF
jgi:predicted acetyltransferase